MKDAKYAADTIDSLIRDVVKFLYVGAVDQLVIGSGEVAE